MEAQKSEKRIAKTEFKPSKLPIFLGLFPVHEQKAQTLVVDFVRENLKIIQAKFGEEDKSIAENLNKLMAGSFKFPNSHHITTYFVQKGADNQQNFCFSNFQEGISNPIEVTSVAYIPNQIICGTAFPDPNIINVANQIPHLTLLVDSWAPVMSNKTLQALFLNESAPLHKEYFGGIIEDQQTVIVEKFVVDIQEKGKETVYFVQSNIPFQLEGITKAFGGGGGGQQK